MDTMTLTKEQMELKAMVPTVQSGNARVRELTPAQRRAVMFAQQQVLRARAAKKAKDERQAALTRIWREEDAERVSARSMSAATETTDEPREVSLREAIGHVLRDLRTHDPGAEYGGFLDMQSVHAIDSWFAMAVRPDVREWLSC